MNIWLIQIGEPLPIEEKVRKMRTALLADKLVERGHDVLWWVSAFNHFKKDWYFKKDTDFELKNKIKIKVLKGIGYKKNISLSRFIDHRIIAWKFRRLAPKMPKPDLIVASMPPHDLAYQAVMFAKKYDIPVLVDIRDEWPDIFLNYAPQVFQGMLKALLFKEFQIIKEVMLQADGLISMMNSLLEWGLNYAKRQKTENDKVFYLGTKKIKETTNSVTFSYLSYLKDKFVVTYVGTFVDNNDPSILIDCAKKLIDINICFVLAGDGELKGKLKNKASNLQNLIFTRWLNEEEFTILLEHSHLGILPTPYLRDAMPNKTFTYLSTGLPVISAFQGDLKEFIEKYQIGLYYPPNDVDALVNCIIRLYKDRELYAKMSANARRVFDEMFDADKIYTEYAEHIERVACEYKKGAS